MSTKEIADMTGLRRLSISFGLMVAASVVSGGVALVEIASVQSNLNRIVLDNNLKIRLSHEMSEGVNTVSRVVPKLVLLHDKAEIDAEALKIERARQRYDAAWALLQGLPADAASHARRSAIQAAGERARGLNDEVVELARAGRDAEATALYLTRAVPAAQAWRDAIDEKIRREELDNLADYQGAVGDYGEARLLLAGISLLNMAMGLIFGWLMVRQRRRDIASTAELRLSRVAAEESTRAKSAFLANMSHEIRTPMNGVLGLADLLGHTRLDDTQRKYVKSIRQSGQSLMALLNDILDLSKVEAGAIDLELRPIDLRRVLQASCDLMAPAALEKGLTLSLDIHHELATWVSGDSMRLQQVLNNLLSNAIKFSATGPVRLSVQPESVQQESTAGLSRHRFCVQDSGPGIPAHVVGQLFQPFSQADASTSRRHGGSGLGLAIARQIVAAMGGVLALQSTSEAGSTFCFAIELPAAPEELRRPLVPDSVYTGLETLANPADAAALSVLLVEDNPVNQIYCQAVLEQMGHRVALANDGLEAVRMEAERRYDLILMDCHMPGLDGFDATRQIRRAESQRGARRRPIVALTAAAMFEDQQRCRDAGMDDVLTKPFNREQLGALLDRVSAAAGRTD